MNFKGLNFTSCLGLQLTTTTKKEKHFRAAEINKPKSSFEGIPPYKEEQIILIVKHRKLLTHQTGAAHQDSSQPLSLKCQLQVNYL